MTTIVIKFMTDIATHSIEYDIPDHEVNLPLKHLIDRHIAPAICEIVESIQCETVNAEDLQRIRNTLN